MYGRTAVRPPFPPRTPPGSADVLVRETAQHVRRTARWRRSGRAGDARGGGGTGALPCAPTVHAGAGAAMATMVVAVETRAHCHAPLHQPGGVHPDIAPLGAWTSSSAQPPNTSALPTRPAWSCGPPARTREHGCRTPKRAVRPRFPSPRTSPYCHARPRNTDHPLPLGEGGPKGRVRAARPHADAPETTQGHDNRFRVRTPGNLRSILPTTFPPSIQGRSTVSPRLRE
ncbi:hypothetical protein HRbin30_00612 [bacterium HR30]|nr:hypothetical protein HRbin30_00612 [bacterium HR30]